MADAPVADDAPDSKDPLASLAGQLRHASTGTLARLRRFDPVRSAQSALFDTERLLLAAGIQAQGADRMRWALLLHCLALVQGRHDARADAEPGKLLWGLRFSEARLRQLVEADQPVLFTLMPRLARRLGIAGVGVNWWPLAELVLNTGSDDPQRTRRAANARQRLVQHYLEAQGRAAADPVSTDHEG